MALDGDGRFLGLRVDLTANLGAYISQYGPFIPHIGATMSTGVYDIPALAVTIHGVYTNTCPVDAYRGAGRPEAAFLLEKLVDECARELGIGREEIRRRNFIRPEQFPYRTATDRLYDVGEFDGHMTLALERAGWASFDAAPEAVAGGRKDPRHRHGDLYRGLRLPRLRAGLPAAQRRRHGDAVDRHADQRPGPRHRLFAVHRRKAQHRHLQGHRPPGRHRPARRPAAAPAARARSRSAASRPRAPARTSPRRSSGSPPTSWKPRPPTSSWSTAPRASSAPTARWILRRSPRPPRSRATSKVSASSCRTSAPIRTAPTSARSRSIRRPARPRSSTTRSSTISA